MNKAMIIKSEREKKKIKKKGKGKKWWSLRRRRRKRKECQMNRYNAESISDKLVFIGPHCPRRRVMRMVIVKVIKKSRAINAH